MEAGALLAAIGAIVAAGAGLLLVIRNARSKGRRGAIDEADALEVELEACRRERLEERRMIFRLREQLAEHGLLELE